MLYCIGTYYPGSGHFEIFPKANEMVINFDIHQLVSCCLQDSFSNGLLENPLYTGQGKLIIQLACSQP